MSRTATALAVAVAAALGVRSAFLAPLNHNVAWLLHVALRWLDGARPYVDVVETNPPLIVWLTAAAVRVTGALGLSPIAGVQLAWFALAAVSSLVSGILIHRATRSQLCAVMPAVVLMALPAPDFGEREHLLIALTLPYVIVSACPGLVGRGEMIAVGVAAAVGVALKPYFLLLPIVVEAVRWRETRRVLGPATIAGLGVLLVYLLAVLVLTPQYLPFALWLRPLYAHFRAKPIWTLIFAPYTAATLLTSIAWAIGVRRSFAALRLAMYAGGLALLAGAFVQAKGFSYHLYPAAAMAFMFFALTLAGDDGRRLRLTVAVATVAFGALLLAEMYRGVLDGRQRAADVDALVDMAGRYRGQSAAVLSTTFGPSWPGVLYAGLKWSSPVPSFQSAVAGHAMHPSPGPYRAREAMPEQERRLLDLTVETLMREQPAVIIVDRSSNTILGPFDPARYLNAHPSFPDFWRQYMPVDSTRRFVVYEHRK